MKAVITRAKPDASFQKSFEDRPVKGWVLLVEDRLIGVYPTQTDAVEQAAYIAQMKMISTGRDFQITIDCRQTDNSLTMVAK